MNQNIKNNFWMYLTFALAIVVFSSAINSETTKSESFGGDPYSGEIMMFAGSFSPRGYEFCNGGKLSINNYQLLFNILGARYGGDVRTTFAIPNLQGRLATHYSGTTYTPSIGGNGLTNLFYSGQVNKAAAGATETVEVSLFNAQLSNRQPYLGINFCIARQGEYPTKN